MLSFIIAAMGDLKSNSILPFSRNADFYLHSGKKWAGCGDYVQATKRLRKAYEMQPDSEENAVAFADILSRIQRYEESNYVLLSCGSPSVLSDEALYGLCMNFIGMESIPDANACLRLYLKRFPNGRFSADAADYLDLIGNSEELSYQLGLDEGEDAELLAHIQLAKAMHFSGLDAESAEYLQALIPKYPDSLYLQTEIALAEFSAKKDEEAEFRVVNILKKDPHHVRGRCILSLLRLYQNRTAEATDIILNTPFPDPCDLESATCLLSAYMEADLFTQAEAYADSLNAYLPYDQIVQHQRAYSKYMLGKKEEALKIYQRLLEMDEHDTVATYYIHWIEQNPDPGTGKKGFMPYYEVSYAETLKRCRKLTAAIGLTRDFSETYFNDSPEIWDLFSWSLSSPVMYGRDSLFQALASIGGDRSERLLRRYLVRMDQPDDLKQRAFSALQVMGASAPVNMYYHGAWQYNIMFTPLPKDLPRSYIYLYDRMTDASSAFGISDAVEALAMHYCGCYIHSLEHSYPRLSRFQTDALCAAFVFLAMSTFDKNTDPDDVCRSFGISKRRLNNALDKIVSKISNEKNRTEL